MPPSSDKLRAIKTFDQLVSYLEDDLDWPLREYGFDDLTFEYKPAELGLKDEDEVKVRTVHQLRPLEHGQPWGIFFVEFEKKKLPVVVLRRILSHLVIKKRASANKAKAAAWDSADLLFISAFGDEATDQREIAFAHFHQESGDLPTLRVLGWDGGDTPLKLEHVATTLKDRLHWPEDPSDHHAWRVQWSKAFRHRIGHVIRTSDALAEVLAALAKKIRVAALELMKHETNAGPLRQLHKAFQTALIHDLTEKDFADTYAQTITYGLLTAAFSRTVPGEGTALLADNVVDMVPMTNPFLREMLQTFLTVGGRKGGIDFDELGIQDVVEFLRGDETDLAAVLRDFGNQNPNEDPVIHFYEHFLAVYDREQKVRRGVFYTPQPVVSYIVRSVHELLRVEFGLADGLADTSTWGEVLKKHPGLRLPQLTDEPGETRTLPPTEPFVQILDPATGTGTFLVEVIDIVFTSLKQKWTKQGLSEAKQSAAWNEYVPRHLLPRLHGYELLMAPYAIAHMKIGLKLQETGYKFANEERARIYLTNALEPKVKQLPQIGFDALAHEAAVVNEVKWYKRFTVIIGNPPYAIHSANLTQSARAIVDRYRLCAGQPIRERGALQFEKNLQNDYVKFVRFAEALVTTSGLGVVGFITSHAYLSNRTLRGMRESLTKTFSRLQILNLHGNSASGEASSLAEGDKNVFDITEGVSISLLAKGFSRPESQNGYADLAGTREAKYAWLTERVVSTSEWKPFSPAYPNLLFRPSGNSDIEFNTGFALDVIFPQRSAGVITARDEFAIDEDRLALITRAEAFAKSQLSGADLRAKFNINDKKGWDVNLAQAQARQAMPLSKHVLPYHYRPFDSRFIAYNRGIVWGMAYPTLRHTLRGDNYVLIGMQQYQYDVPEYCYIFISRGLTDSRMFVSKTGVASLFPLYLSTPDDESTLCDDRPANVNGDFIHAITETTGLTWASQGVGELVPGGTVGPEATLGYIYALLHSPEYRTRFAEPLRSNYPRVFMPSTLEFFAQLSALGRELIAVHLLSSPTLSKPSTRFVGDVPAEIEKATYARETVWLDKAQSTGFAGVPEAVWNFHIGGYQVCEKWLKDRKGRTLSKDDITHYHKIVVALSETIRLMNEIDEVINTHGGWPGAFRITTDQRD